MAGHKSKLVVLCLLSSKDQSMLSIIPLASCPEEEACQEEGGGRVL
jgi:hypothetical protein